MFLVAAIITGFGALGPAAVAILAPVALRFAAQYRISPVMMGLMVIHGAQGGGFSPISVYGGITNQIVEKAGLPYGADTLFLSSLFFNLAIAIVVFFVFGGWKSLREHAAASGPDPDTHLAGASRAIVGHGGTPASPAYHRSEVSPPARQFPSSEGLTSERLLTLIGLTALAIGALVFKFNVGLVAITVAVALALLSPKTQKAAIDKVSWSTVLLIAGIITYVGVLQKAGTVDYVAIGHFQSRHAAAGRPAPVLHRRDRFGLRLLDRAARRDHSACRAVPHAGTHQRHRRRCRHRDLDDDRRHQPVLDQWCACGGQRARGRA